MILEIRTHKIENQGETFTVEELVDLSGRIYERKVIDWQVQLKGRNHWTRKHLEQYFAKKNNKEEQCG